MGFEELDKKIREIQDVVVMSKELMSAHTSLEVGGPADLFIIVHTEKGLAEVLEILEREVCPWLVIGAGTNLLVTDEGIEGAVIMLGSGFTKVKIEDSNTVFAEAGCSLTSLLEVIEKAHLSGLEALTGIPGSVGGAVAMNAGTWYGDVSKSLMEVRLGSRAMCWWMPSRLLSMSYRSCCIPQGSIILAARFRVTKGITEEAIKIKLEILNKRATCHPPMKGTAGSFFKNVVTDAGKIPAARLIEDAGLKGRVLGGAIVSPKHANFIMNNGNAKAKDLLQLAEIVREEVLKKSGIALQPEVRIVGRNANEWRQRLGEI